MDTHSPSGVPCHQDFMWSQAALAADMAELALRALSTAAPRFWTVGTKVSRSQSSSLTTLMMTDEKEKKGMPLNAMSYLDIFHINAEMDNAKMHIAIFYHQLNTAQHSKMNPLAVCRPCHVDT